MSDMFTEYDGQESNAMRVLREKAEADSRALNEMRETVSQLSKELSTTRVEKVVTSKGYDPGVAALAVAGGASTPEAVEAWLNDNGKFLAKTVSQEPTEEPEGEKTPESVVPEDERAALAAIAAASQGATPSAGLTPVQSQVTQADSPEAVMAALAALRGGN